MKYLLIGVLFFAGCSVSNTTQKVKNFAKCYVNKIPAPFWVCYQSTFSAIGKLHTDKVTRLKQEEAYSIGVSELVTKLTLKTKLFLKKLGIKDEDIIKQVKSFVIINNIQGDTWYSKDEKMLYVEVKIDKNSFKKMLLKLVKNKKAKEVFDEVF